MSAYAHMARALELAARGRYSTHPNPRVGCVIVRGEAIVGEGFHARAGEPHAEVLALRQAGERARGADVYVTLEPCCHHGRTPPCVDALIAAGVRKVHAAMTDPNPRVAGQGLEALRKAGIECELGPLGTQAALLNAGFVSRMSRSRPHVTLKLAMSLDGRTAMASGESRWITGPGARADVQRLRAEAGAVLTGINTLLTDDPQLNVREFAPEGMSLRQPDRIVLDSQLRSPPDARAWAEGARRIVVTASNAPEARARLEKAGVEVVVAGAGHSGRLDLGAALAALARLEVNAVLAECGPTLAGALLKAGLVDELVVYVAPSLLGESARALAFLPGLESLEQRIPLQFTDFARVGSDLRITAQPALSPE